MVLRGLSRFRSAARRLVGGWFRRRPPRPVATRRAAWTVRASALLAAWIVPLLGVELLLRVLPVHGYLRYARVDAEQPIHRFKPDQEFTWSRDWNFSIVNTVAVNNAGFVSDVAYRADAPAPLLAVVGDSYVEAVMVPYRSTCAGRLATLLEPAARVYSFGMSGAPLSQYLAFARHARDTYRPGGLVVVVIDNDYDESLIEYGEKVRFHQFVDRGGGRLALERIDHAPSLRSRLLLRSALVRYLVYNLQALESARRVRSRIAGTEDPRLFSVHTPARAERARVAASKRAVDAFLDLLPAYAGLDPGRIVFVVDGIRYGRALAAARGSFVDVMRRYFLANADRAGYETIDLQPRFIAHYRRHRRRFEWPWDDHWNALGHERCFDAVAGSGLLSAFPRR